MAKINPNIRTSIMRVIGNASRDLGIENPERHLDKFVEWSFEAMKFIGSYDTFPRMEKDLTITDKRAALPDNMIRLIDVKDEDGVYCEPTSATFRGNINPGDNPNYTSSLAQDDSLNGLKATNRYYIDNGGDVDAWTTAINPSNSAYININLDNGEKLVISYFFLPVDQDGFPMVKEGHEEAISSYLMWKFKALDYYAGKVPQYIYKDLESRWHWLCGQARGNDNMPTPQEWERVGQIWNTLIPVKVTNGLQGF